MIVITTISCACAFIQLFFFFFNDTAPPEIYPLPLPDAFPIFHRDGRGCRGFPARRASGTNPRCHAPVPRPRGLRRRTRGGGRPDRAGVRGRIRLHTDRTTA